MGGERIEKEKGERRERRKKKNRWQVEESREDENTRREKGRERVEITGDIGKKKKGRKENR